MTETATPTRPTTRPWTIVAGVVIVAGVLVTSWASIVTAHNSTETCQAVAGPGFAGDPEPCW